MRAGAQSPAAGTMCGPWSPRAVGRRFRAPEKYLDHLVQLGLSICAKAPRVSHETQLIDQNVEGVVRDHQLALRHPHVDRVGGEQLALHSEGAERIVNCA